MRNSKEDKITKEEVFEGLIVPNVKLYSFVDDYLMGEERVDCEGLLNEPNCYRNDNPWSNLYRPKVCTGLNCCRCIFFGLNAERDSNGGNKNERKTKMENEVRSNMKCPECGRTVLAEDVVCPDCGTLIDDTEMDELEDLEQEYSDSFEEEYQNMYDDVPSFRNIHTQSEVMHFDELIEVLRSACKEVEKQHIKNKRLYRGRELLKKVYEQSSETEEVVNLLPLAGAVYEKSRKHIRGVCWVRYIANLLHRGVPVDWIEEWDSEYFKKVLSWLPLKDAVRNELIEAVESW